MASLPKIEIELNAALVAEVNKLRSERDAAITAVRDCVDWADGREYEWGEQAENAFGFLHRFLANADAQNL